MLKRFMFCFLSVLVLRIEGMELVKEESKQSTEDLLHIVRAVKYLEIGKWCCKQKNYAEAFAHFTQAQERESNSQIKAAAECWLGMLHFEGKGVERNFEKAVAYFEKAVMQGNAGAQFNLGVCYEEGKGVIKDEKKAFEWYEKAAIQGNAGAQYALGLCYDDGKGVEKDYKKAFEWYEKAAMQGDAMAQFVLGGCYAFGLGVEKDHKKAMEWYEKEAPKGHIGA